MNLELRDEAYYLPTRTEEQTNRLKEFISSFTKHKTLNRRNSSYRLKHFVERAIGFYVHETELIKRMTEAGFECTKQPSPNAKKCFFNISQGQIRILVKQSHQSRR